MDSHDFAKSVPHESLWFSSLRRPLKYNESKKHMTVSFRFSKDSQKYSFRFSIKYRVVKGGGPRGGGSLIFSLQEPKNPIN